VDFINKINASFNRQERWNAMKTAVRYILEQSWVVPVAMRLPTYGLAKAVRGFAVDPQMIISLRTTWLDK
jgi:hypothetical protein